MRVRLLSLLIALWPAVAAAEPTYTPGRWIADLEQMKQILADRAPNLDWALAERGIDLPAIAELAEEALKVATTDAEARVALRTFLSHFGDGHISLIFPDEKDADDAVWGTASICKGLGYETETRAEGLPFTRAGGRALDTPDSAVFPLTLLDLPSGKLGVLRIPSFYEWGYFQYCPAAVAAVGLPEDGECDESCGAAIGQKAAELLTEAVARQIEKLKAEGVAAIVVDITQNGGGSLWLDPVARMLTPVKLKSSRLAFVRGPVWQAALSASLASVEGDLANPITAIAFGGVLNDAKTRLAEALAEARATCDRAGIWQGQPADCEMLSSDDLLYATGTTGYAEPGEYAMLGSAGVLFYPSYYSYREGIWTGPLYVLMDEGSASAAEQFAALLRDNGAAVLIGEPTYGAGCGWMSGNGEAATLNETRAEFYVPDCVWTRKDGSNEVAGIEPDIAVPWRYFDNPFQKARRAVAALSKLDLKPQAPAAPPGPTVSGVSGPKAE